MTRDIPKHIVIDDRAWRVIRWFVSADLAAARACKTTGARWRAYGGVYLVIVPADPAAAAERPDNTPGEHPAMREAMR
jgi:hypothetical protein